MILALAAALFVYAQLPEPGDDRPVDYNFLYEACEGSSCRTHIVVSGTGRLERAPVVNADEQDDDAVLYLYNTANGDSHDIELDLANQLYTDDSLDSPDGFHLVQREKIDQATGSVVGYGWFLVGNEKQVEIHLTTPSGDPADYAKHLVWIVR